MKTAPKNCGFRLLARLKAQGNAKPNRNIAAAFAAMCLFLTGLPISAQAQFTYVTNNNAITITGYTGPGGDVIIPDSVTSLGNNAFASCQGLINVAIGNGVASIGYDTFDHCSSLTSVAITVNATNIGPFAFFYCSGLTNVTFGNNVKNIGDYAFRSCSNLTKVVIPPNVTGIGFHAFEACTGLHEAYFQGNAPTVSGAAGSLDSTVFSGESGTVYYVPGTSGWGATFGGWPTAGWYQPQPQILGSGGGLGVQGNGFQFTISWATNVPVVVEASTNLQAWTPVITNTLVNSTNSFADPTWTNYAQRFYRVHSQ